MDGGRRDRWTDRQARRGWVSGWMEGRIGGWWVSGFPVRVCPVLLFQPDGIPQAFSWKLGRSHPELWCQRILTTSCALMFIEAATGRPAQEAPLLAFLSRQEDSAVPAAVAPFLQGLHAGGSCSGYLAVLCQRARCVFPGPANRCHSLGTVTFN